MRILSRFHRSWTPWVTLLALWIGMIVLPMGASAAGVRAAGEAKLAEWKKDPTAAKARSRAIRRARIAALAEAIEALEGPTDPQAVRATTKDGEGWTGAYRILSEHSDPQGVRVELEVDIDLARLAKRVAPASLPAPKDRRFHLGEVKAREPCEEYVERVQSELERVGVAAQPQGRSKGLDLEIQCDALGPVPNTLLRAVRVRVSATSGSHTMIESSVAGFGVDDASAWADGLATAADEVASAVLRRSSAGVFVRVEAPHPAARIRHLQRALADSVRGVRRAELVGVDPDGSVRLRVVGSAKAKGIARGLQALSLPDFSITIVGIDDPNGLTIRLR